MDLKVSSLYLFKEQSHLGRCIVAYKNHVSEIINLSKEERELFLEDISSVASAIHTLFKPDKVNYGFYGDTGNHLHCHLCSKYKDGYELGGVFLRNPHLKERSEEELKSLAEKLNAKLSKN